MNRSFLLAPLSALAVFAASWQAFSQTVAPEKIVRPRTVAAVANKQQTPQTSQTAPKAPQPVAPAPAPLTGIGEVKQPAGDAAMPGSATANINPLMLTPTIIQSRISEAERLFKTRPQPTAMSSPSIQFVNIAAFDRKGSRIHVTPIAKEAFLKKGSELTITSSLGEPLTIRVIRANGVNTALTIFAQDGRALTPLVVEFPIEKGGTFKELAYYTSAHPALLSNDLTRSGQAYVRNMLDLAAKRLRDKGEFISNDLIDIAERLCLVEHVDHDRFKNENRLALYDEIYSLYALNEIDTYRYSVSSAGAGGMVQMIPWAYNLIRQRHPGVGLIPDFVTGMRNHSNALQAMLLYMRDTWNDLAANEDVKYAMNAKLATMSELMAAGYNSNAAKLPTYLRRGGEDWKILIPRETQMYLQIYKSFEGLVPIKARATAAQAD
jgi:hypothetical protein